MQDGYLKGRGAQVNTRNKFLSQEYVTDHIEGLDEEKHLEAPKTEIFFEHPKKIVNKVDSPDLGMVYSLNPYQGCEHGCIYCYARNVHEYWGFSAGLDFERKIIVKENAPRTLEQQILHKSWKPMPIMVSGNTDCYQPLERRFKLTRGVLEVMVRYRHPVSMITKNVLVLRDIDLLTDLASDNLVHIHFSITTLDEKLRSIMEPRTASAIRKLKAIEALSKKGVPVSIMNAPIIPGLNHHEIPNVIKAAADHGALSAGYTVVRLNGAIGPMFEDWLKKNFPDRFNKVWNQICDMHGGQVNDSEWGRRQSGEGNYANSIASLFRMAKKKYMSGRKVPPLDITKFRRGGNLSLF
ncbi:MAG: PA0069 family radical SAM protein [Bacteroidota bacterium]